MNLRATHPAALALGLAFALGTPAAAQADTFCVKKACGAAQDKPTIAAAIGAAAATQGTDRIEIGPGTFTGVNVEAAAGNTVEIVGSGAGTTRLVGADDAGTPVVRTAELLSTVSDLTVQMGGGNSSGGLRMDEGLASNVDVVDAPGANPTTSGYGVTLGANGSIQNSHVLLKDPKRKLVGVIAGAPSPGFSLVHNVEITANSALESTGEGLVIARALHIHDSRYGVTSRTGGYGSLHLFASLVHVGGSGSVGIAARVGGANPASLRVKGVTVIGDGKADTVGVAASATPAMGSNGGDKSAQVRLRDTVVRGFASSLQSVATNLGVAGIDVAYSDYDPATTVKKGSGAVTVGPGNVNVTPGFVSEATGDYRLMASSPLVDAGDPAVFGDLEWTGDLAGHDRVLDGDGNGDDRIDMGAYEYVRPGGSVVGGGGNGGGGNGGGGRVVKQQLGDAPHHDSAAPVLGTLKRLRNAVQVRLSESGSVRMVLSRRAAKKGGRARFTTVSTSNRTAKAGVNSLPLGAKKLRPGSYRLVLTATDAAGNRSASRTLLFRVTRSK